MESLLAYGGREPARHRVPVDLVIRGSTDGASTTLPQPEHTGKETQREQHTTHPLKEENQMSKIKPTSPFQLQP